jgi:para-nitrobenzyl esterase
VNRVIASFGLRYAELPGGERFAAPVRARGPAGDRDRVRRLVDVPVFPQLPSRLSAAMGTELERNPQAEDAFLLNVWAPEGARDLPVLVYLHGGAWATGGGSAAWYDGSVLAARGIVVVTVNYRVGPLAHLQPGDTEVLHNRPVEDLLLALDWVQENISSYGGDPLEVTVAGHSAGGWYGHALSVHPAARGLLRRVAHLSMGTEPGRSPELARAITARVQELTGDASLQRVPLDRLLAAGRAALAVDRPLGELPRSYLPAEGEFAAPDLFDPQIAAARCHAEAVYLRTTADETGIFSFADPADRAVTDAQVDRLAEEWGAPPPAGATPYERLVSLTTRRHFLGFAGELAAAHAALGRPVQLELFEERSPLEGLGAAHCFDLPFQFGNRPLWGDAPMLRGVHPVRFAEVSAHWVQNLADFVSGHPVPKKSIPH